ncbi:MAG: sulfurtransferase [Actinobacteria bacterium]|nr:MAG: sulfurtransferase [Actinomycetota bacterium]
MAVVDSFGPLVDAAWLSAHLAEVVVCDVRWYLDGRSGRAAYDAGHIPEAVFVDLDRDLASEPGGTAGRHPLPDPSSFAAAMGRLGISDATTVVAYDDTGGSTAARLVWMLRVLGRHASLLDGGIAAWHSELSTDPVTPEPATFTSAAWPEDAIVDADGVAAAVAGENAVVLDARAGERYRGEVEPIDARAGHVPGARSLPWADVIDPATGRFRTPDDLRARLADVGITAGTDVIAYCGSGVTSCIDVIAVELAGYEPARLFVSSWSGWSNDPDRRVATGAEPGGTAR